MKESKSDEESKQVAANQAIIFGKLGITPDAVERLGLPAFLAMNAADQNTVMSILAAGV